MTTAINYTRPFLYPYQKAIVDSPARFTCTEAATKIGKSASHLIWLFEQPLALNLKAGQAVWWVAPVYGQAEVMFNRLKNQLSEREFLIFNETKLTATYPTGAVLHFKSGEKPDNLYGDDVYAVVIDEASRLREASWHAVRSTLTSTGGKCKMIGNVRGRKNWFYRLCQKVKNGEDPKYAYFKITAYDAAAADMRTKDGRAFAEEIEDAKGVLPDNVFKELYLAEASDDGINPFGFDHIRRAVFGLSSNPPVCFGIDLAKKQDWTVITGLDKFGHICRWSRFRKDWGATTQEILTLPPVPLVIDATGVGDPIAENVQRSHGAEVESFIFTPRSKQMLMEGLALGLQKHEVTLLEGVLQEEAESLEFEYTRTGVRYTVPEGMTDDAIYSLGLAYKNHHLYKTMGDISVW